jgi:hypothetical protein
MCALYRSCVLAPHTIHAHQRAWCVCVVVGFEYALDFVVAVPVIVSFSIIAACLYHHTTATTIRHVW